MEGELFQGGVLMHSYLRAVGFSRITKRSSIRQIITDVVETYDEKTVIENYPDGMFVRVFLELWMRLWNYCLRAV